ncbi:MAG: tRNA preQ1(34) S-adenosylmethionine ribosyltransferase-isomerase QueA [Actinomycetota bacterium]|nr:tRNA preQ1(34) S-adenosylmethionine ribosyltransferase-isomerase QueA [Actinomycetota bacterium]
MDVSDFEYDLPAAAIAQVPVEPRDAARLLVDRGAGKPPADQTVAELADLVGPGDVLVVNDSRVLPARLLLRKATGGAVEVLLLEQRADRSWEALVRPSRRVARGTIVTMPGLGVEIGEDLGGGRHCVRLDTGELDEQVALERYGEVPLPPYISEKLADPERYQTVFARRPVSVAAPTAGLHLTRDVLARCEVAGARIEKIELAVGAGTFRPITAANVEEHHMHAEAYQISPEVLETCKQARRVIAIGTTVVRALESAATTGETEGSTELFIRRGHRFAVVDSLLTNFHVPRSSLLVLIDAFVGPRWRELYDIALERSYRFLSFGDAMLLHRADPSDGPSR